MHRTKSNIVIIGEGFGGIYTATELLKKNPNYKITLIGRKNYFLFTPLLHEVATGGLSQYDVTVSIDEIFKNRIRFIHANVEKILFKEKSVITSQNQRIEYDRLVIATGAKQNTSQIEGAEENSLFLKNIEDAIKIKNSIVNLIQQDEKNKLFINIIGAGPTGVELICEIHDLIYNNLSKYYDIQNKNISLNLITSESEILKQYTKKTREYASYHLKERLNIKIILNTLCEKVEQGRIIYANGNIESDLTITTNGVKPATISSDIDIQLDKTGRILINNYLQLIENPYVYAIGDIAGGYSMDAQIAVRQSKIVAINIIKSIQGDSNFIEFKYNSPGKLLSLGSKNASGDIYGISIHGYIVWFLWRTVYFFKMPSIKKRFYIGITWALSLFYNRDISIY